MKLGMILVTILLLPLVSFSQQNDYDPFYIYENIPSSPEASNLGSYGNSNASLYNGKVNLSIPIYNISFDGINIPIQLSYNSSGVRASQDASWVGLNWNLSSQFAISRRVNGIDDLRDDNALFDIGEKIGFIYNSYEVQQPSSSIPYMEYDDIVDIHSSFMPDSGATRQLDLQPDIFEVSLFGYSYKFRFQKKGASSTLQTKVFNNNNVIITYNLDDHSFKIIDEKGFQFDFSTKEINTTFSSFPTTLSSDNATSIPSYAFLNIFADLNKADESIITTWYLDKITSPQGEELNLSYQRGLHFTFPSSSGFAVAHDDYTGNLNDYGTNIVGSTKYQASTTIIENPYLSKIDGKFGEVNFNLGLRNDLMTGKALNDLSGFGPFVLETSESSVSNCHGTTSCTNSNNSPYFGLKLDSISVKDFNGNEIINTVFNYDYFNNHKSSAADKERYLRLKLNSVEINEKQYSFTYKTPDSLPAKDTWDVDFWGFYNGANNTNTVPSINRFITQEISINNTIHIGQTYFNYSGADRGSNFQFGKIGLLTKVNYPTGGNAEFEYEPHDALVEVTQPYVITEEISGTDRIKWTSLIDESKYNFTYQYLKKAVDSSYDLYDYEYVANTTQIQIPLGLNEIFSITSTSVLSITSGVACYSNCENVSLYANEPLRVVENIDNPSIQYVIFTYGDASGNQVTSNVILPAGNYKVISQTPDDWYMGAPGIPVIIIVEEQATNAEPYMLDTTQPDGGEPDLSTLNEVFEIGGARIKSITNKDADGSFITKKIFDYTFPNISENLASSGVLMDELIFFSKPYGFHSYNPRGYGDSPLKLSSNNTLRTTPSAQGSHIGYSFVTETSIDSINNSLGRTETNYSNIHNQYYKESFCRSYYHDDGYDLVCIDNAIILGLDPSSSGEHSNGNVLLQEIFDNDGAKVSQITNTYSSLIGTLINEFFANFIPIFLSNAAATFNPGNPTIPFGADNATYYAYQIPQYFGLRSVLEYSENTEFRDGQPVTTEENYTYNADTHHLTSKEFIPEQDKNFKSDFYYPYDTEVYNNSSMADLRLENQLATVIKMENFLNTTKLNTKLYNFEHSSDTDFDTMVTSILTSKGSDSLEYRMLYEKYDDGKLLQSSQVNGTHVVYIWGYNHQYPIAKIENAKQDDFITDQNNKIAVAITASDLDSIASTEVTLRQKLEDLRLAFDNSQVTTYTYDPLIGVTSIKDPSGYTSFYVYDDFNRLLYIKDKDGIVLKSYKYHYKGQEEEVSVPTYTVTNEIDGGVGSVSLNPSVVESGSYSDVTATPSSGYEIDYIKVGTTSYPFTNNTARIDNITADTEVHVQFKTLTVALNVNPTFLFFEEIDGNKTITVTSGGSWTVSKSDSWITISTTTGSGNGTFTIRPLKNLGSLRTGTVTVSDGSTSKTISIEQLGDGGPL